MICMVCVLLLLEGNNIHVISVSLQLKGILSTYDHDTAFLFLEQANELVGQ